ncbi:spore photoproduct lyase [Paenibacillus polymyxa]|jgi:spore photoproduct lyase|uniref:spore photoproduct lyase n=1 Tax=Paenibacillus TaxID=44249 RepID=UPI0002ECAD95|nr:MULTISPECIES: spore photoproduct lyase [Paenibacillus]AHM66665.1 spore photoproduct lyase [Paenibacillus polymyxa SQR-21]AIY07579.1 Spore photoproduct lyase [Paenibacillus polymyxa]AUS27334.1 radical SAM protein [Paenibacillus polymyxa]KAE8558843.1 spore photoproduct lyase [Paenibacillus polymyxa]KAF6584197.1 spore photoproduct lyase [Paenibacillus sp. EKM211P]
MSTLERTPVQIRGTKPFMPDLVFFEPDALNYPKGQRIMDWVKAKDIPYRMTTSHNRITNLPGETEVEKYRMAKKTLVVGIRKTLTFDQSKPSAEYAIPISTGCMGHCHYCYLQTTLGAKPYIRIYVNTDDIISAAKAYIEERAPEITRFEAACTSDPVGLEHITGSLGDLIRFMADEEFGRLRFVTKYHHVDPLLDIKHNGHTRIRFSINSDYVIKQFEPATSRFEERIEAAGKIARAGYPLGFIIAPIIWYDGWEEGYGELLRRLGETLPQHATKDLTFELIQHRFTKTSKAVIEKRYPKTKLEMDIEKRKKKWGRWGQNKYVYPDEQQNALREFITERIFEHFPLSRIEYFT